MLLVNVYILNTEFVHLFMDLIKYTLMHVLITQPSISSKICCTNISLKGLEPDPK